MTTTRIIIGIYLLIHAISHLVGFVVPWKIATLKEEPYKTTLLSGAIDVGDIGIRIVGILWLLAAAGFMAGCVGVIARYPWWRPLTFGLAVFSLVLCIFGLPGAKLGIPANAVILVYLIVGGMYGWVPV